MRLRRMIGAVATVAALLVAVFGFAPAANATNWTPCNGRHDFVQLWTEYHGYPACFANQGTYVFGDDPPNTTWSVSDICAGANQVYYYFYRYQNGSWHPMTGFLDYWDCYHLRLQYGEVEMSEIDVV